MLRFICENFSTITAKICFLLGPKHAVYAASFEATMTSCDIRIIAQHFTSVIYNYINTICIAK